MGASGVEEGEEASWHSHLGDDPAQQWGKGPVPFPQLGHCQGRIFYMFLLTPFQKDFCPGQ